MALSRPWRNFVKSWNRSCEITRERRKARPILFLGMLPTHKTMADRDAYLESLLKKDTLRIRVREWALNLITPLESK